MSAFTKVLIVLKDADSHEDYNKRIIEYLNDRHPAINDNKYTIAIEVADESNINDFVREGMESVPSLRMSADAPYVYGVNSILSTLAKLEISESFTQKPSAKASRPESNDGESNDFYKMAMKEMLSDEQDDPDQPSTIKAYHQDLPESPLTDKVIEEKTKAYSKIYDERRQRNGKAPPQKGKREMRQAPDSSKSGINVDKFISDGGYDQGEALLMRQIVKNL